MQAFFFLGDSRFLGQAPEYRRHFLLASCKNYQFSIVNYIILFFRLFFFLFNLFLVSAADFSEPVCENLNVLYHLSCRDISCLWFLCLQNSFPLWEVIGVQPKTCQFWIVLDMHLAVHKIFYWYWSEIAAVIVFSPPTWISLSTFYFAVLKFGFCSCFAWKVIRSDVSCTTHFNILDKLSYVFIPVDRFLIWSMGRYLTSRINIPPTRNPRAILSVFCRHDF